MSTTLYVSMRCKHSVRLLEELQRVGNDSYHIVDYDKVSRRMLPPAITGVPMALMPDGRPLYGKPLFDRVFGCAGEPDALFADIAAAPLEATADDPESDMAQFYQKVHTPQEDGPDTSKQFNLDALRAARSRDMPKK